MSNKIKIKEIPIPKGPCIIVLEGIPNEQLDRISEMTKDIGWPNGVVITNKETFISEPRYSVAELKKLFAPVKPIWLHSQHTDSLRFILDFLKDRKKVEEILNEK